MMGWGICMFYSSVGTQSWCLLHIQKVRLGRERKVLGRERKVLAAEQRGTCPLGARWGAEPRLTNPAGSVLALHDWGTDLPSFSGKARLLQERSGPSSPLPCPKRLFNESLGLFFLHKGPGARDAPSHRMVRQQLKMERHLERGRVIRSWIKMKCQEKKRMMKREKVNQINQGNGHLEEALIDPAVKETFWTRLPSSHRLLSPWDACCG